MLHGTRSKDRASIGGPSYMNNSQVASYLKDLRQNKPLRPAGARPSPFPPRIPKDVIATTQGRPSLDSATAQAPQDEPPTRSENSVSHQRSQSAAPAFLGRPLIRAPSRGASPTPTTHSATTNGSSSPQPVQYMPDGRRWMERQEALSLRKALEDMDMAEEQRVHKAAQDEASELVWKHQNPDAPYRYRDHLRKGSYTRNHSQGVRSISGGSHGGESVVRDFASGKRSASGGSASSKSQTASKEPSDSSLTSQNESAVETQPQTSTLTSTDRKEPKEDPAKISFAASIFNSARRRSGGGSIRKTSGASIKSAFTNPNDRIYEEVEDKPTQKPTPPQARPSPVPERRNPFARLRSTRSNVAPPVKSTLTPLPEIKRLEKIEIQRNPPSQSNDPDYVSNEPLFSYNATAKLPPPGQSHEDLIKMKNGVEVRSDDIRAATSKRLSDRSVNLPTPVLVSDKPGRPIVSFKEQKQILLKEAMAASPAAKPSTLPEQPPSLTETRPPIKTPAGAQGLPTAAIQSRRSMQEDRRTRPSVETNRHQSIPIINLPDSPTVPNTTNGTPSIPSIAVNDIPRPPLPIVSINDEPTPQIPTIAVNDTPSISIDPPQSIPSVSINAPEIPTISISDGAPPSAPPNRPLPTPSKRTTNPPGRPHRMHQTPHVSLAGPPRASSALCTACALPIAGRIVSAAGSRFHPGCFQCHNCAEALECVAFYPEPDNARAQRIDRIRRRLAGELVKVGEHSSEEEDAALEARDGWVEDVRFYCHLDFHEFFSPRCKSCKTPIEGEVIVACGANWHAGHFFCAQCGDPFDAATPFVEKDGYAWCVNCHTNRYSTKCKRCRKPVVDTVVKALGAEWHEQCFSCTECGGRFDDGRYFLRPGGNGQDPVCVRCEDRRLKA